MIYMIYTVKPVIRGELLTCQKLYFMCTNLVLQYYTPHIILSIYSINLNEVEILGNPMCFPMFLLNDCLNFKKYEY